MRHQTYCVTTPVDSRLPGGGGQSLCGLADINPAKLGLNTNEWIRADDLGARQVFDGVDVNVNARLRQGVILQGGVSVGRLSASLVPSTASGVAAGTQPLAPTCFVVDSPQVTGLCNENPPFQAQIKGSAVVPLPWWKIETAVTYQSMAAPDQYSRAAHRDGWRPDQLLTMPRAVQTTSDNRSPSCIHAIGSMSELHAHSRVPRLFPVHGRQLPPAKPGAAAIDTDGEVAMRSSRLRL